MIIMTKSTTVSKRGGMLLGFGGPASPLIDIVQHDTRQQVRRVLEMGSFDGQGSQLLRQPIPAEERTEVYIDDF